MAVWLVQEGVEEEVLELVEAFLLEEGALVQEAVVEEEAEVDLVYLSPVAVLLVVVCTPDLL